MKQALFLFAFCIAGRLQAQDCKSHLYMTSNASLQMTVFDKKGKASAVQTFTINSVKNNGSAYESAVSTITADDKGKTIATGSGTYRCNGGVFSADMRMAMPQEGMAANRDAEVKFEPVYVEYPAGLSAGQSLKDATFNMNMTMKGGMKAMLTFKQENRKVTGKESVTSPAGTWEAYTITYDGTMKSQMGSIGLPAFHFTVKEWFVPGMGVVKTETYNKAGKVIGGSLITSVKR